MKKCGRRTGRGTGWDGAGRGSVEVLLMSFFRETGSQLPDESTQTNLKPRPLQPVFPLHKHYEFGMIKKKRGREKILRVVQVF